MAQDREILTISTNGRVLAGRVVFCLSSAARRAGLLRRERLTRDEGALLVMPEGRRGKAGFLTSIHTLGMRFPLIVAWLDEAGEVVHAALARPWRPYCASPRPAWYVLEVHPDHLDSLQPGAKLEWGPSAGEDRGAASTPGRRRERRCCR